MTWLEAIREALTALRAHRLRAALSAAGIVFGVATIVAALAVAQGARRRAYDEIGALGIDNVYIRSARSVPGRPPDARFSRADLEAVAARLPGAARIAGARRVRTELEHPPRALQAEVAGVTEDWNRIAGIGVARGRALTAADDAARGRVIVLAPRVASALFGGESPLGGRVRVAGDWFTVVGVLAPARGAEPPADAYVPAGAADVRLGPFDGPGHVQDIAIQVAAGAAPEVVAGAAAAALRSRGHASGAFEVVVPYALLRARLETERTFDWVLFGVGGLALLISGIGIMNIMLASVAERAGEIGVRRAAGARRRDVLAQFAAEAALLCVAGGAAGVPIGGALAAAIATLAGWPVEISIGTVATALALAGAAGVVFGIYPARRAARLDPIEALRG